MSLIINVTNVQINAQHAHHQPNAYHAYLTNIFRQVNVLANVQVHIMLMLHQWNVWYQHYANHSLVLTRRINVPVHVLLVNGKILIIIDVILVLQHACNVALWVNVLFVSKIHYCMVIFVMLFVRMYWKNIILLITKLV